MQRYLTSYMSGVLTVHDRLLKKQKKFFLHNQETAELIMNAIKNVNYEIKQPKAKVKTYTIDDVSDWLDSLSYKTDRTSWGNIHPSKIKWEQPKEEVPIQKLTTQEEILNNILFN